MIWCNVSIADPPLLSGAGRLDIPAAADAAVVADTTALSFGLAGTEEQVRRTKTLTLENVSTEPSDVRVKAASPVAVSPSVLRLAPGERRAVTVTLAVDAPAEDVQGWVDLDVGGRSSDLRVPYALPVRAGESAAITPSHRTRASSSCGSGSSRCTRARRRTRPSGPTG